MAKKRSPEPAASRRRSPGRPPRRYPVHGEPMTIPMAARLVHVNTGAMRTYIHSHRCTLEEAYDHYKVGIPLGFQVRPSGRTADGSNRRFEARHRDDSEERRINQAVVRLLDIINPNGGTAHEDCA